MSNDTDAKDDTGAEVTEKDVAETLYKDEESKDQSEETTEETETDESQESKEGSEEKSEDDQSEKEGAPEEYGEFSLPEGTEINEEILGEFRDYAKTNNLNQEQAQNAIDMGMKLVEEQAKAVQDHWENQRQEWRDELKADPKFDETLERAQRVIRAYSDDDFVDFLNDTGFGDHPMLIKMLAKIDGSRSEDSVIDGDGAVGSEASMADRMYSSM